MAHVRIVSGAPVRYTLSTPSAADFALYAATSVRPAYRWPCDREHLAHVLGKRLAKALGIGRHWAPLVPLNGISLTNRLAPVCYADDSQCVAIGSQERRNDRHPLSGLREREQ